MATSANRQRRTGKRATNTTPGSSPNAATNGLSEGSPAALRGHLIELYEGRSSEAVRFRYALLVFDLTTIAFIVVTSFLPRTILTEVLDALFGLVILADVSARFFISRNRFRELANPVTWADAVAVISFLAPLSGEAAGFLRVLRTLRLLHTYQLLNRVRRDSRFFRSNEDVIFAVTHLAVFIFIMTAIVYETQHRGNPDIANYIDALYFTVSSLTTTGYGDIVLSGTIGRFISVVIMIFGVTLFLRLARAVLQPYKVRFPCPECGLQRHDGDAVHCKACGHLLNIPDEGDL
jgi:voltage-gated potassium channel